MLKGMISCT